ncbi:MAG: hypothetical protein ABEJ64_02385 [Candidatus Nanohaloarchaea archaeon]
MPERSDEPYNSWEDVPGQSHEPSEDVPGRDPNTETLNFLLEEKKNREMEAMVGEHLDRLQLSVEEEFHENGNFIMYQIMEDGPEPVIVVPEGDRAYASQQWLEDDAEKGLDPLTMYEKCSRTGFDLRDRFVDMKQGIPEGLKNLADRVAGDSSEYLKVLDTKSEELSYVFPVLEEKEYRSLES